MKRQQLGLVAALALAIAAPALDAAEPEATSAATVRRDERPIVAIYEFRSGVPEVGARATTDLFVTALVRSGLFRVVERSRINEGVLKEKQLGAQNAAGGDVAPTQLAGARYLFEGTVSEANASQDQSAAGVNIGGMEVGGGHNRDAIAIDVRVLDAATGEILDVVTVHREINTTSSKLSGVGSLVAAVAAQRGHALTIAPDVHVEQQHKESLDAALRTAIEDAVRTLAAKFNR